MIWFWRFLKGYLIIRIDGKNGEQVLNKAAGNGITIWNLSCKKGYITGNISVKNFIKLRYAKRGIKCKIKVLKKKGMIFYTKRYINRTGFIAGIAIFFILLELLSSFIWVINVDGNINISTGEIINSCKNIGISNGMLKKKINNKYDAQKLLLQQKDLAWCSLVVEGSVLTVNLSEAAVSDKQERQTPSNIKAEFDGKIKKINIASGNTVVKVGDTVSKGDLLVSGIMQNMSSTVFVHSSGEIIADTKRTFSAEGEFVQTISEKTGKIINRHTVNIFGLKIPLYLGNVKGEYDYQSKTTDLTLLNKKIPIQIACERYEKTHKTTVTYDKQSLEEILYNEIQNQIKEFNFISAAEGEKEITYTDKGMLLKIEYFCEENIAVQDKILLDTEN